MTHDDEEALRSATGTVIEQKDKEIAELREKLGLWRLAHVVLGEAGTEELSAIKAAEYRRGCIETTLRYAKKFDTAFSEGKQAGREEAEKEAMEQEPVAWVYEYPFGGTTVSLSRESPYPANAYPVFSKPFPQQKPLSDSLVDTVCLIAAEIHNLGRGVSDDKAQEIINKIRAQLEAAHGITGEKK